jgi:hypothetical protein
MSTDPIIEKYISLIKANTNAFSAFFQGDPIRIPASLLPCVIIAKRETEVRPLTNSEDEHAIGFNLTVVSDIRNDLSTGESFEHVVKGISTLYDLVEGRGADYSLKDASILGILRANPLVDAANNLRTDLGTSTRVDYGETLRGRAPEQWSIEATVQFVAHFVQNR